MQVAAADDSMIGMVLADKYRVVRQIGRGGMGIVYEAEHLTLGKRVAIKLMLEKYAQDGEAAKRFEREAYAASRIGNPHIIDVFDIAVAPDGRAYVVMELLNGMPLAKVIEMTGPLPPWRAISIMRQVLRAIGAAHAKGIIHRDLKPDNIFLVSQDDQHDFVKLLDFGISKVVDPDEQVAFTKLTTTGVVMGTPLYMAPEQAMGHVIERHADIYACGVILYEMLAGKPPFEGQTYAVLVAKLLTQDPPLLGDLRPGLPGALVTAVHRALEKEPKDRYANAEQFLAALPGEKTPSMIELAGTLDSQSAVAVSPPTEKRRVGSRLPLFAIGALLVAAAAVVTVLVLNKHDAPPAASQSVGSAPVGSAPAATQPATDPPPVTVGQLQVSSTPGGATVWIDDQERGVTPIETTLTPGRHKVRVALDGYDSVESEQEVRTNSVTSIILPLAKAAPTKPVATKGHHRSDVKALASEPVKGTAPVDVKPDKTETEPTKTEPKKTGKGPDGRKPNPY